MGDAEERPLILLSNDDGIQAEGLAAMKQALSDLADVVIVAPDRERSASSHAISLDRPLRVESVAPDAYAVDGTPVDCVYLGVIHLVPRKPALCISGINAGYNLGSDVFYSGTVAAAVEAALRGVPSIAISLAREEKDFSHAARLGRELAAEVLQRGPGTIPEGAVLNLNCPPGRLTGYRITFLGRRVYRDHVDERRDLRGRSYYWIGGPEENVTDLPGSDCSAVQRGWASVTPLGLDLTHTQLLRDLQTWDVGGFVRDAIAHDPNSEIGS